MKTNAHWFSIHGGIVRSLNERKIPSQRGSRRHVSSVANLLARAQKLEAFASNL